MKNKWYNDYSKRKGKKKMDKRVMKKTGEELQQYLAFRRRGFKVPAKKGKGSYNRKKMKRGDKECMSIC